MCQGHVTSPVSSRLSELSLPTPTLAFRPVLWFVVRLRAFSELMGRALWGLLCIPSSHPDSLPKYVNPSFMFLTHLWEATESLQTTPVQYNWVCCFQAGDPNIPREQRVKLTSCLLALAGGSATVNNAEWFYLLTHKLWSTRHFTCIISNPQTMLAKAGISS